MFGGDINIKSKLEKRLKQKKHENALRDILLLLLEYKCSIKYIKCALTSLVTFKPLESVKYK